jgi:hypothetical protein
MHSALCFGSWRVGGGEGDQQDQAGADHEQDCWIGKEASLQPVLYTRSMKYKYKLSFRKDNVREMFAFSDYSILLILNILSLRNIIYSLASKKIFVIKFAVSVQGIFKYFTPEYLITVCSFFPKS